MMKFFLKEIKEICFILISIVVLISCKDKTLSEQKCYLIFGKNASTVELNAIQDLKEDLSKVINGDVFMLPEDAQLPSEGMFFILGTPSSNSLISNIATAEGLNISSLSPGPRGGIWSKKNLKNGKQAIVIGGSNAQGLQYAIYDYSKEILGIDALEYWTGKTAKKNIEIDLYNFDDRTILPPEIPILGYFENDVDELANYRGALLEYDWESYTELINSLVRLRYNAIHFFDMLGRPEFYKRPDYRQLKPDYKLRLSYVDSLINYAHSKGMMVQIDLSLGYKIKPLEQEKADCWKNNKQDWIDTWQYYLEETPFAKADIFSLRPRNQVWDWEYKSSCGENKIDVFNEVCQELGSLIDKHNPNAKKIVVCYADGMEMFNQNFNPPKDWAVAWSDDGWGGFKYLPKSTKGYDFGTYMHAGFWKNHTVHDPYPVKIDTVMKQMAKDYQANTYCLVNGQQFRPFLLNIEAFAEMSKDIEKFDGNRFYKEWTQRYFGNKASEFAINAMELLHKAQFDNIGYVEHLWEIREAISYLSNSPIKRPGKTPIAFDFSRVISDFEHVEQRIAILQEALNSANKGLDFLSDSDTFYHDYIVLPIYLYKDLLAFENCLHEMAKHKKEFENTKNINHLNKAIDLLDSAQEKLKLVHERRLKGDNNKKWKNWYNPEIRRPNNGFPSKEMLLAIRTNLFELKNT